jgi:hypothetical protein
MNDSKRYYAYIKSWEWTELRKEYEEATTDHTCYCCKRSDVSLSLHHKTYKRLFKEHLTDLCLVCSRCHFMIHKRYRSKRSPSIWNATDAIRKHWRRRRNKLTRKERADIEFFKFLAVKANEELRPAENTSIAH